MSTIRANTLLAADGSTTTEPSIPALDQRMAKAWVNFNGTGTVAIRDAYNVSSITDNGVGIYAINFNVPLIANYSLSGMSQRQGGEERGAYGLSLGRFGGGTTSTTHCDVESFYNAKSTSDGGLYDNAITTVTFFGS